MTKTRVGALAALAVAATVAVTIVLRADDAPRPADREAGFKDKILVISLKSARTEPVQLEKVETRRVGDQWFLVGSWFADGRRAPDTGVFWVPVTEVAAIEEFADRDQYRKAYAPRGR
jgi:hypothetical protein